MYGSVDEVASAKKKRKRVVYPKPNELFIDLDSDAALGRFYDLLECLELNTDLVEDTKESPSASAGHYHVRVTLTRPVRDVYERLLLQACLGSDTKRELLGYCRAESDVPPERVSCFFEALP